MNEHKEQAGFYLVLPSTSSNEIFLENHTGRFTVLLPKEIHLDEEFYWEMALVELFWPKQDSLSVPENLWYEIQVKKEMEKNTHSNFFVLQCEQFIRLCKTRIQGNIRHYV